MARGTPPSTARRQASIFGTIPLSSVGSSTASSAASISLSSDVGSGQSAYRPATSVSTISFSACSPIATAAAAVSALTL